MHKTTTLDFLRHGEARGGQHYRGTTDDALTERGWRQMYQQCGAGQWDAVISSPLRRCRSFASAWCEQQLLDLRIDSAWAEYDFGDWEGLSAKQIERQSPDALQAFYRDPIKYPPPNAESYLHFAERISLALDKTMTDYAGHQVLIVTHAGVIRAIFSQLLNIPPADSFRIEVPHAALSRFSCFEDDGGRYLQFNFHKSG